MAVGSGAAHVMDAGTRARLEELAKKRFFYAPAFSIYGGVAGLYDYGPAGCALQANILAQWRRHFVLEEGMLEVESTVLTLHDVLKASGHVDRFTDYIVRDAKTGDSFRVDHLLKAVIGKRLAIATDAPGAPSAAERAELEVVLAQLDGYGEAELQALLDKHVPVSPETGNPLGRMARFNLMFPADIGPTGQVRGYMRPETAQGMFVNFRRLLDCNGERMPFAAAQIGKSFRNEISPRAGLLRVREFTMAEIEHFVHPERKSHPRFVEVADMVLPLLSSDAQEAGGSTAVPVRIGDAVAQRIVDNETLGYFLARTALFLHKVGVRPENVRFRQHLRNEMSHYASDCWDAEIRSSYGWVECVGCADRSAYDLTQHAGATGERLVVRERLPAPVTQSVRRLNISRRAVGQALRSDAGALMAALEGLSLSDAERIFAPQTEDAPITFPLGEKTFAVSHEMAHMETATETVHVAEYVPNVIEPSFGIGRILYSLLENVFWVRPGDLQRCVLSLPAAVAPTKVLVAPLSPGNAAQAADARALMAALRAADVSATCDESSTSIGRRYARADELGVPFGATLDFASADDRAATLRERDSTQQVRVPLAYIPSVVRALVAGESAWPDVVAQYGLVAAPSEDD